MEYTGNIKLQSLSFSDVIRGVFIRIGTGIVRAITKHISSIGNQIRGKSSELRLFLPGLKGPNYRTWHDPEKLRCLSFFCRCR